MKRIMITGAAGYIGNQLAEHLDGLDDCWVLGVDIKPPVSGNFAFEKMDVRNPSLGKLMNSYAITHVVHLASIVNPGQDDALEYDIDVNGTANVLNACAINQVKHITVTSSGAAYGYYADNPAWLTEADPLRGNEAFSYSRHKRLVEEMLAEFQQQQPEIAVLIMRPCTVLGHITRNRITALFERNKMLAIGDSDSPFVFIWDKDVVMALAHGVSHEKAGAYNLAGDGALTVVDLANIMNKKVSRLSPFVVKPALWLGKLLGLSDAGPEQIIFLQYRPVLCNKKLKTEFGYVPEKSSRAVFEYFWQHRASQ